MLGIGLLILVKGADILVGSASKIAKILRVPAFMIGLFIVAIGTSAPEAAIGVISGIKSTNLITLGDVIGSSIVNITVIIGITALIFPLEVESTVQRREILISIFVQACLIIMIFTSHELSRLEAIILLAGLFIFLGYIFVKSKKGSKKGEAIKDFESEIFDYGQNQHEVLAEDIEKKTESMAKQMFLFLIGLICLIVGANMAVNSAVQIANDLGLSETFIGLTVVALGTSLPELVTSLIAVYKREEDIAVGNIIGSNIFNILLVLSVSVLLHPIEITADLSFDLFVMLTASVMLFIPTFFFNKVSRKAGFVYLAVYIIYLSIKLSGLG